MSPLKQAFRDFRKDLPKMVGGWWIIPIAGFFVLLLVGRNVGQSIALAAASVPAVVPLLGMWWFMPAYGNARPSPVRVTFAVVWMLVTFVPAILVAILIVQLAGSVFGIAF